MKQKILYLHIGMPKTATTVLQHFFAQNREVLRRKGIVYPLIPGLNAHHRLGWSIQVQNDLANWWFDTNLRDYHEEWEAVLAQCSNHKILLSTESLWGLTESQIALVREVTSRFDVKIVIYVRRQDVLMDSWYNELVKIGISRDSPESNDKMISLETMQLWKKFFGADNLLVRPYEKQQFCNGTIFADFLHHILGLELTDDFVLSDNKLNSRLHRIVLEYKRMVNFMPLASGEQRVFQSLLQEASARLFQQGFENYSSYSPQQRVQVYREYREAYAAIARQYLKREDGRLFYDPPPDPTEQWRSYPALKPEDARTINHFLAAHYPDQLKILVQAILEMQFSPELESRQAALSLLPGIPPSDVSQVVVNMLLAGDYPRKWQQDHRLHELFASKTWKAGQAVKHIFRLLPAAIRKPLLRIGRKWQISA